MHVLTFDRLPDVEWSCHAAVRTSYIIDRAVLQGHAFGPGPTARVRLLWHLLHLYHIFVFLAIRQACILDCLWRIKLRSIFNDSVHHYSVAMPSDELVHLPYRNFLF